MATQSAPEVPLAGDVDLPDAAVQRQWRKRLRLSSVGDIIEASLSRAGFDRGPWLAVAFASGIGLWFILGQRWQWIAVLAVCGVLASFVVSAWREREDRVSLSVATLSLLAMLAAGVTVVWTRSELVGAEAIDRARVAALDGTILEREERPARGQVRLVIATRDPEAGQAIKVRVNVPIEKADATLIEGARIRLRARLMPPAPPILPGAYDFARAAWFDGLAATGSLIGEVELVEAAAADDQWLAATQRHLSSHVRANVDGSAGAIAGALASGDRGAISEADEVAMRDAGLTHLLSISGLHVSAVIAAAYFMAMKLLGLWPWLVLRARLPLVAACIGALAGVGYTLLTGAEVPTVRSCVGALLVLVALAIGREPLSMRMVAVAAFVVLLLWPESLIGPSFQMSFAAVIAIVSLHGSQWARSFLAPREESWRRRFGRRTVMLFLTGLLIEFALMPIVLFHFHRAGIYGAFANVIAIPLVTFVTMPLLAIALFFDLVGLGAPFWWLVETSLDVLIGLARFVSEQPGSVKLMPQMSLGTLLVILGGLVWLALWQGRARLFGLIPVIIGAILIFAVPVPDILITRDGRHVAVTGEDERLLVLRESRSSYARDNLLELAGSEGEVLPMDGFDGARCSSEFCVLPIERGGRSWRVLMARSNDLVEERALAAACDRSDIVIADRFLPRSCQPRWLKADRAFLEREGGLSVYLADQIVRTVGQSQGEHGWWRGEAR